MPITNITKKHVHDLLSKSGLSASYNGHTKTFHINGAIPENMKPLLTAAVAPFKIAA